MSTVLRVCSSSSSKDVPHGTEGLIVDTTVHNDAVRCGASCALDVRDQRCAQDDETYVDTPAADAVHTDAQVHPPEDES